MFENNNMRFGGGSPIIGILLLGLILYGIYFITSSLLSLLWYVGPVLLLVTAFIDHKVILNYGKYILNLFKTNPLMGVIMSLLTVFGFPFVCTFLFGKVMLKRKINKLTKDMGAQDNPFFNQMTPNEPKAAEFTEFEEVQEEFLKIETPVKENQDNSDYDKFF